MKIAVLGGGVAAFEAANAARKFSAEAEIAIFSNEPIPPYRRPALSGMLADFQINEKMFFIKPENFYADNRITLHLNTNCTAIEKNALLMADGSRFEFDRLVIATGSVAFRPDLPGKDLPNVYTFRNFADLKQLDHAVASAKTAVIIGGGVLGLELAESMLKRGLTVTVLERNSYLFSNKLTPENAADVEAKLRAVPGLALRFGVNVVSIASDSVTLDNGENIAGDIVIMSAGSRPVLPAELPTALTVERGIVVNRHMQTSCSNIYAAGDAIQLDGKCFGLYNDARTTGMIAGANAAGANEEFQEVKSSPVRCFCFGLKLVMP